MVWTPPYGVSVPKWWCESPLQEASMNQVSTVGLDLAKHIFQLHGADSAGAVVFRKKLRRGQVLAFPATLPPCTVALEACASAHSWGREIAKLGHTVKLIAPAYVKPFVKRQKNDMADAEAICEAAQRPTMRFVAVKSEQAQAAAVVFRTRDLLVRQRTQAINALRGHLAEFGVIAAKGPVHASRACKLVGVITPLLLLLCGHHSRAGSPDSAGGRRPRVCRSARPCARRGRVARVALFQRICCALFRRLATIALTALSTNAVEIGSPRRRRAASGTSAPRLRSR